jgi:putative addiction module component (TIGR02574 family)
MTDLITELSQRARSLAPEDRARLAEELLASLAGDVEQNIEAAWDVEIQKRIEEIESGSATLIPADEVFSKIRRKA